MNLLEYRRCLNEIDLDAIDELKSVITKNRNIIILGNGGSNAISCHIAEDYTKALGKRAICFGDSARLSCYANDYGWEHAYTKFVEHFGDPGSLIILISSSGESRNILNVAEYARGKYQLVTMSGFNPNNSLRVKYSQDSLFHFWVDSKDYGIIECLHELILHSVI